jgi:hypothetical protein
MAAEIEYHPLFWEDVEAHALYLETEAELGAEFLNKVEEAIASAKSIPKAHSRLYGNTRDVILERFRKHSLHFEYFPEENLIRCYGLFHSAESPNKWDKRL